MPDTKLSDLAVSNSLSANDLVNGTGVNFYVIGNFGVGVVSGAVQLAELRNSIYAELPEIAILNDGTNVFSSDGGSWRPTTDVPIRCNDGTNFLDNSGFNGNGENLIGIGNIRGAALYDYIAQIVTDGSNAITLGSTHNGRVLFCTDTAPTITVPGSIPLGFNCLVKANAGATVTFVADSGAVIVSPLGLTVAEHGIATVICIEGGGIVDIRGDMST